MEQKKCWLAESCNKKDCHNGILDDCFCLRYYKLDSLYNKSLLSDAQRNHVILRVDADGTDFDKFKRFAEIEKDIVNFVNAGKNLYIHSSTCGNGKSTVSIRLIEAYFNAIWPQTDLVCRALFISVPKLLISLKDNISERNDYANYIKENILSADLVVWDDIGNKLGSTYEIDQLLNFIDNRISNGKTNIYTSNLNPEEIRQALGDRLASRICQLSEDIELHGKDKRHIIGK